MLCALLQILTEDRMAAGFDADGSCTTGRVLAIVGGWNRIAATVDAPGAPWDKAAAPARAGLCEVLRMAEPILARTARPSRRLLSGLE